MHLYDLSRTKKTRFTLREAKTIVFWAHNLSGEYEITLAHPQARAYFFGIYEGKGSDRFSFSLSFRHTAPNTFSRTAVRSVLRGASQFRFRGNIHIEKNANGSNAALENRNMLLGEKSFTDTKPFLEILADAVRCTHSVATAPPDETQVSYLCSRSVSPRTARSLLAEKFLEEIPVTAKKILATLK